MAQIIPIHIYLVRNRDKGYLIHIMIFDIIDCVGKMFVFFIKAPMFINHSDKRIHYLACHMAEFLKRGIFGENLGVIGNIFAHLLERRPDVDRCAHKNSGKLVKLGLKGFEIS